MPGTGDELANEHIVDGDLRRSVLNSGNAASVPRIPTLSVANRVGLVGHFVGKWTVSLQRHPISACLTFGSDLLIIDASSSFRNGQGGGGRDTEQFGSCGSTAGSADLSENTTRWK